MMIPAPELQSPCEWGWFHRDSGCLKIYWTTLPEATLACGNSSDAVARKVAEGSANVSKQHSSADVVHMIKTLAHTLLALSAHIRPATRRWTATVRHISRG